VDLGITVADAQITADVRRGQNQHQRGDHARVFFRVLMRLEKLAWAIDQQVVQSRFQVRHPQSLCNLGLQGGQCIGSPSQRQRAGVDLASVPHVLVQQRGLAPAVARRSAGRVQGGCGFWCDGVIQRAHVAHRHGNGVQRQFALRAEVSGWFEGGGFASPWSAHQGLQGLQDGKSHGEPQKGRSTAESM
jgi:hypothetical protein